MGMALWDAALRGAAGTLFLLLAVLFARDWRLSQTARIGAVLTVGAFCYVALVALDSANPTDLVRLPLHLMSLATPGFFWLFAMSWFDDDFELRAWHAGVVAVLVACGFLANFLFWKSGNPFFLFAISWRAISVVLIGAAIVTALRGRNADLVETRRRARLALSLMISLVILWVVLSELPLHSWPPPVEWRVMNAASLFLLAATLALTILGWRDSALLAAPVKAAAPPERAEVDDSALLRRLDADMRHERLYRQDGLTITAVAARLGVPEYRLRRAINRGLGARNFNAYLNDFRLDEARQALIDPQQRDVPIVTIALDAGFGSLAPFNRAFRNAESCTPTEFRARH